MAILQLLFNSLQQLLVTLPLLEYLQLLLPSDADAPDLAGFDDVAVVGISAVAVVPIIYLNLFLSFNN